MFDGFDPPEIPETREGWRLSVDCNGLIEWDTVAARMDQEGTPHHAPGAMTPCGKADEAVVRMCNNP